MSHFLVGPSLRARDSPRPAHGVQQVVDTWETFSAFSGRIYGHNLSAMISNPGVTAPSPLVQRVVRRRSTFQTGSGARSGRDLRFDLEFGKLNISPSASFFLSDALGRRSTQSLLPAEGREAFVLYPPSGLTPRRDPVARAVFQGGNDSLPLLPWPEPAQAAVAPTAPEHPSPPSVHDANYDYVN